MSTRNSEPSWESLYDLLKWQSDSHDRQYRTELHRLHQLRLWCVALAATATTIMFHDRYYFVGFILPAVIFVVGYMGMSIASECFALKAYRDHVDRQLARLIEGAPGSEKSGPYIPWAMAGGKARLSVHEETVYQVSYALAGIIGGYVGIIVASVHTQHELWVMIPSLVVFTTLILVSIPIMKTMFGTYGEVTELIDETTRRNIH